MKNNITLEVPYTMTSINVNAKTSALYATKRGTGIYNLTTDYLEFDVYIEGEYHLYSNDGNISQKYHFKVKRALRDTDVSLSELIVEVKGEPVQFDKEFKPDILSYNVVITDDDVYSVFIKATANSKNSTVSNVGNIELATLTITSPNTYVIDVKVIAEAVRGDLEISQTYKLFLSQEKKVNLDNRNDIFKYNNSRRKMADYIFANEFNPTKDNYEINVEYSVKNIYVQATGNGASIVGSGVYQLTEDAKTEIVVYAISESGNIGKKYTFNVYRAKADTDSSLKITYD
ncbi:MAG: cadherin-like beta sandwich domain-containing protein [Clostridium sp.]|nr:MAG: cadherin-like beta sandwich domain-containing protein [Clostridium sp.]